MTADPDDLATRLEMLLVLQWLDEHRPADGRLALSVTTAAADLSAGEGRGGVLAVMAALGDLEERGRVTVEITGPGRHDPVVTLGPEVLSGARRAFGN